MLSDDPVLSIPPYRSSWSRHLHRYQRPFAVSPSCRSKTFLPRFSLLGGDPRRKVSALQRKPLLASLAVLCGWFSLAVFLLFLDGRRSAAQCRREGSILKATLPPLSAGRHFISLRTDRGNLIPLVLPPPDRSSFSSGSLLPAAKGSSPDLPKEIVPVYSIPLMAVKAPRKRPDPQLCYSTLRDRRSTLASPATRDRGDPCDSMTV